ncbi:MULTISPECIES: glycosyl transferase family protein [Sphingomonas]|uniref:Glycosyl transferase family protein n=1 Tax=Sphingomonas kyungheensis TaxID=1069987 RepID=A0ABU8H437_9SPHN|nr:glycosyl transferase family protein [Sphingomonas sp. CV7422]
MNSLDGAARESMLFASVGLLLGGIDDLAVDLCFLLCWMARYRVADRSVATLPPPAKMIVATFVAAWQEAAVIEAMLATASSRLDDANCRIFVGVYPNDPDTIRAAAAAAVRDARIRVVIGAHAGPTTKADCLNSLWVALCRDDADTGRHTDAVIIHDAEDVVHRAELRVFSALLPDHAVVQLPVLPLVRHGSWVSGHYADEFAYAHGVQQPVRALLGAPLPLAGTGCAMTTAILAAIAAERSGRPFDTMSLTEDYELGLRVSASGRGVCFARLRDPVDGSLVAVRAYFPEQFMAAVRQKARWMTGIALAGWDRIGWGRPHALIDHWMRMRDRRGPIAVIVLTAAYLAVLLLSITTSLHWIAAIPDDGRHIAMWLWWATTALFGWRLLMRMACTASAYGWGEAWRAVPRFFFANAVMLVAALLALRRYQQWLCGSAPVWDKTSHRFPELEQGG